MAAIDELTAEIARLVVSVKAAVTLLNTGTEAKQLADLQASLSPLTAEVATAQQELDAAVVAVAAKAATAAIT